VKAFGIVSLSSILRFTKFGIVGGSGVIVNVGLLHLFTAFFKIDYKISSIIAIECAIINNFLFNYFWTWNDRRTYKKRSFFYRLFKFHLSSGFTALIVNWGLLVFLTEVWHIYYHISNLIGIGCGSFVNFLLGHFWVFSKRNIITNENQK
jgi:dolichol-phosphate mannosyltransferase